MKKYFLVRPSCFWLNDSVNIDGEFPKAYVQDFNISENETVQSALNFLIFEVPCWEVNGKVGYGNEAREIVSKNKYTLNVGVNINGEEIAELHSDYLGLYMIQPLKIDSIECKPSKVSGLVNYLNDNKKDFLNYKRALNSLIEYSRFHKELYDETVSGPSKYSLRCLRNKFMNKEEK